MILDKDEEIKINNFFSAVNMFREIFGNQGFVNCNRCFGTGVVLQAASGLRSWDGTYCDWCGGKGVIQWPEGLLFECEECGGTGLLTTKVCPRCGGKGYLDWIRATRVG